VIHNTHILKAYSFSEHYPSFHTYGLVP